MAEAMETVELGPHHTVIHNGVEYGPGVVAIPVAAADYLRRTGELPPKTVDTHEDLAHIAANLRSAGYETPEAIKAASDSDLLKVPGIGPATLKRLREL